jgi:hypothetical protein
MAVPRIAALLALAMALGLPAAAGAQDPKTFGPNPPEFRAGPCTEASKLAMPDGDGHDHLEVGQHADLACRMRQVAFLPLVSELAARPDVVLGEMDVKRDIAAVSVAFPEAGALFFDVSDPASPKFLSWYRSTACEGLVFDVDCGAFVDLSSDGKTAFLAIQNVTVAPGDFDPNVPVPAIPGLEVVDISDPRQPSRRQNVPISPLPVVQGGSHTVRSHVIPSGPSNGPRAPGEYVFAVANGVGVNVSRLEGGLLTPVSEIEIDETHDTFMHNDPITNRTYMYVAAGFSSGFYVYDVTEPAQAELVAEWDLTPDCAEDWYSHTIDVAIRGNRRYVNMPTELFRFGGQSAEDQAEGCGADVGNGDKPGPVWIVDASDFSKLGPADASDEANDPPELKANSQAALVSTWTNAADRPGGQLTFSPHNNQIVGDLIYLSAYHAGVVVLDASEAFAGRRVRPAEVGFLVPAGSPTRPIYEQPIGPVQPFFSSFAIGRPIIWDMFVYKGHVLAADERGGLYSLKLDESAAGCVDRLSPRSRLARVRLARTGVRLSGTSRDRGCVGAPGAAPRVARVTVAIGRVAGRGRCAFLRANGRFGAPRSCRRPVYLRARGTSRWSFAMRARLRAGTYEITVRALDARRNGEPRSRTNARRVRLR